MSDITPNPITRIALSERKEIRHCRRSQNFSCPNTERRPSIR